MKKAAIVVLILILGGVAVHVFYAYRRDNVILITIDTLRPDYLSCYNSTAAKTPNLDRIARLGVRFSHAYSLIPITMPSHTSILSSRQPNELSLFNNGERFNHSVPLLPDMLRRKGYISAAFVSLGVLAHNFGLSQSFDEYNDDFGKTNGRYYKLASEVNDVVIPWIERNKGRRFFAWIHYSDPHEPYITADAPPDTEIRINGRIYLKLTLAKKESIVLDFNAHPGANTVEFIALGDQKGVKRFIDPDIFVSPPDAVSIRYDPEWMETKLHVGPVRYFMNRAAFDAINPGKSEVSVHMRFSGGVWDQQIQEVRRNYSSEVQYTDKYIGILWEKLRKLNLLDNTIVIVTADHGEGLKTHGTLGHVNRLFNETTHVPLLIYYPRLGRQGHVSHGLVNLLDIAPTVLDLLHIRKKTKLEGESLRASVSRSPVDWLLTSDPDRKWTFSATYTPEANQNAFSITNAKWKLIHTPAHRSRPWEAYDLTTDPMERRNLARVDREKFESLSGMRSLLEAFQKDAEAAHTRRSNPQLSDEEQQVLRNLGYVGGQDEKQ